MPVDAVLLAAGNSTRIAAVGGGVPKPLLAVQGEPILVRNVRWLAGAGVRRIWVNLHYRGDLIRAALGDGSAWGVEIRYSEEPTILGTAGGVRKVLSSLGETFLVVYGDNLVQLDVGAFLESHITRRADISIAVFDERTPNTGLAGGRVALGADDVVVSFVGGRRDRSAVVLREARRIHLCDGHRQVHVRDDEPAGRGSEDPSPLLENRDRGSRLPIGARIGP